MRTPASFSDVRMVWWADSEASADIASLLKVLQKSLGSWNVRATPLSHPQKTDFVASPGLAAGYICNLESHWFTIRPVDGSWWNFNSLQPAPTPVGDTYLEAYLNTLGAQNWAIYVVEGKLPSCAVTNAECNNGVGRVWTPEQVRLCHHVADVYPSAASAAGTMTLVANLFMHRGCSRRFLSGKGQRTGCAGAVSRCGVVHLTAFLHRFGSDWSETVAKVAMAKGKL
jgi:hypothetical protein